MTKQAPTTKIVSGIENGFYAFVDNVMVCAKVVDAELNIDVDPHTGEDIVTVSEAHYTITSHNGQMPAFHTSRYATIEALANAMREYADLRTWRLIEHS